MSFNNYILQECEQGSRDQIDKAERDLEQLHEKRAQSKDKLRTQSKSTEEAKKRMNQINKDVSGLNEDMAQRELKLEHVLAARHQVLVDARLTGTNLPLTQGDLEENILLDTQPDSSSLDISKRYESESEIICDFDKLDSYLTDLHEDEEQVKLDELAAQVRELNNRIDKTVPPKLRVANRLEDVREKYQSTKNEFEDVRKRAKMAKIEFEQLKQKRRTLFMDCFNFVSEKIDDTYKEISRNPGAQAYLSVDNHEEPYLDGVSYNCVAPGKRFRPMDNLSGGEKTIAALALIFAVHAFRPSPFFVLDEVDAALDNTNIGKVADYIRARRDDLQVQSIFLLSIININLTIFFIVYCNFAQGGILFKSRCINRYLCRTGNYWNSK